MEYALPLALMLLVITGCIVLLVMRSTRRATPDPDDSESNVAPGIDPDDETPAADTDQHAGRQRGGETVADYDAGASGGAGRHPASQGYAGSGPIGEGRDEPHDAAHVKRPGEAEGASRI